MTSWTARNSVFKQLPGGSSPLLDDHLILQHITLLKRYSVRSAWIAYVMIRTGLRISEVLALRWSDRVTDDIFFAVGLKGSASRSVSLGEALGYCILRPTVSSFLFPGPSRVQVWRDFKKAGISRLLPNSSRHSVTHLLRYQHLTLLNKNNRAIEGIQEAIGHKSVLSTVHYLNKTKI